MSYESFLGEILKKRPLKSPSWVATLTLRSKLFYRSTQTTFQGHFLQLNLHREHKHYHFYSQIHNCTLEIII